MIRLKRGQLWMHVDRPTNTVGFMLIIETKTKMSEHPLALNIHPGTYSGGRPSVHNVHPRILNSYWELLENPDE